MGRMMINHYACEVEDPIMQDMCQRVYDGTSPWEMGCLSYLVWDDSIHAHTLTATAKRRVGTDYLDRSASTADWLAVLEGRTTLPPPILERVPGQLCPKWYLVRRHDRRRWARPEPAAYPLTGPTPWALIVACVPRPC